MRLFVRLGVFCHCLGETHVSRRWGWMAFIDDDVRLDDRPPVFLNLLGTAVLVRACELPPCMEECGEITCLHAMAMVALSEERGVENSRLSAVLHAHRLMFVNDRDDFLRGRLLLVGHDQAVLISLLAVRLDLGQEMPHRREPVRREPMVGSKVVIPLDADKEECWTGCRECFEATPIRLDTDTDALLQDREFAVPVVKLLGVELDVFGQTKLFRDARRSRLDASAELCHLLLSNQVYSPIGISDLRPFDLLIFSIGF